MHSFGQLVEIRTIEEYQKCLDSVITLFGLQKLEENVQDALITEMLSSELIQDKDDYLTDFKTH